MKELQDIILYFFNKILDKNVMNFNVICAMIIIESRIFVKIYE